MASCATKCIVHKINKDKLECQFENSGLLRWYEGSYSDQAYFNYNGDHFCIFHLPLESPNKKWIDTNRVLKPIFNGINPQFPEQFWTQYQNIILAKDQDSIVINIIRSHSGLEFNFSSAVINNIMIKQESASSIIINASNAYIHGSVNITASYIKSLNFEHAEFNGNVSISGTCSIEQINFSNTKFSSNLSIDSPRKIAIKCDYNSFYRTYFRSGIFRRVDFGENCQFDHATFAQGASFDGCIFQAVNFVDCKFGAEAATGSAVEFKHNQISEMSFTQCEFFIKTSFYNNNHKDNYSEDHFIAIRNTKFHADVDMFFYIDNIKKVFLEKVIFIKEKGLAKLSFPQGFSYLEIKACKIFSAIDFKESNIAEASFIDTHFLNSVNFNSVIFQEGANFSNCIFEVAPSFFKATLHPNTIFPEIDAFKEQKGEIAEKIYHDLYTQVAALKQREYEGIFYTLSQRCIRSNIKRWLGLKGLMGIKLYANWFIRFISYLYDLICCYGTNYWRPMLLLPLLIWPFFTLIYFYLLKIRFIEALNLSLLQMIKPFSIWTYDKIIESSLSSEHLKDFLRYLATLETILTLTIFSLLIVALRWRYKRE